MSNNQDQASVSPAIFLVSGGILVLFALLSLWDLELLSSAVSAAMGFACKFFGPIWQFMLLAHLLIAVGLMLSSYGSVRLGGKDSRPEVSFFKWVSMIICALLAGGGMFWSAAEPISHFLKIPPSVVGYEGGTIGAIGPGMAQAFLHWGFLAWAILGTLGTIVLMYACYYKGMPLQPRTLLYPVLGEKGVKGPWGTLTDISALIAVAAGTIGPIGFLSLQLSYAANKLIGVPDCFLTQAVIIMGMTVVFTIIALTPIYKGITVSAQITVFAALLLMVFLAIAGSGLFVVDSFLTGFGFYLNEFFNLSLFRGDTEWLGWWTVFFWGWFLGYGPMMVIFVARISRGRSIRELVLASAIIAPIATNAWFSVVGGSTIYLELNNPGSISTKLIEVGYQTALFSAIDQLPLVSIMMPFCCLLILLFLVNSGASMTYSMAMSVTGKANPPKWAILFWGVMMGVTAAILVKMGQGGINALQQSIVIAAIPVTFYYFPLLWTGPKCAALIKQELAKESSGLEV